MVTAGSRVLRLSALAAASAAAGATGAGLTGLGAGAAFPGSRLITPAQGMLLNDVTRSRLAVCKNEKNEDSEKAEFRHLPPGHFVAARARVY